MPPLPSFKHLFNCHTVPGSWTGAVQGGGSSGEGTVVPGAQKTVQMGSTSVEPTELIDG